MGTGYPSLRLARALVTATTHEDGATRRRAEYRIEQWERVLAAMNDGTLSIGDRAAVEGLPEWATPEVVRGGFATGWAAAGGALLAYELQATERAGVPPDRGSLFRYHLTEAGLADLTHMLQSREYTVEFAEEGALLTAAWLLSQGDRPAALDLLETITPYADRLRFVPAPSDVPYAESELIHRNSVEQVAKSIGDRRENAAVATMNEALAVWNPFADELLALWLDTLDGDRIAAVFPDGWHERAAELLTRYRRLAAQHTRCTEHRKPKENLAILRSALEDLAAARPPQRPGLLKHAVDAMVARRGLPGSSRLLALRARQATDATRPSFHALAQVLVARLSLVPADGGLDDIEPFLVPVTSEEQQRAGVPAGSPMPRHFGPILRRALSAPVDELIDRRVIGSASVLADLVPQLTARTKATAYADEALGALMGATYRAYRRRRSLLLLDLQRQVQFEDLPWVRAVEPYHSAPSGSQAARDTLVRLGELALQGFPGTILPNRLVHELGVLARQSRSTIPFIEELAADIFMGRFSTKFLDAAVLAGELLTGSLYARYYAIDYREVQALAESEAPRKRFWGRRHSGGFGELCARRAGVSARLGTPASNGRVIEQAQILTTHNLAALVVRVGVHPAPGWADLAGRAFATVQTLLDRVPGNPQALRTIKNAAFAWRQMVFFLTLASDEERAAFVPWARGRTATANPETAQRLRWILPGLSSAIDGDVVERVHSSERQQFLGWSRGRHWIA